MKEEKKQEHLDEIWQLFPIAGRGRSDMAFADLFGLGCYLISTGKEYAGRKVVDTALSALGVPGEALECCNAHNEVQTLIPSIPIQK